MGDWDRAFERLPTYLSCRGSSQDVVQENCGESLKGRRAIVDPTMYRRTKIDPLSFGRTKVDPLDVGLLLSILQYIGELRSILCVLGELRLIP